MFLALRPRKAHKQRPGLQIRVCIGKLFSLFLTKTYVVGAQKYRLNETVLLSTKTHMFKLMGKKIMTNLRS